MLKIYALVGFYIALPLWHLMFPLFLSCHTPFVPLSPTLLWWFMHLLSCNVFIRFWLRINMQNDSGWATNKAATTAGCETRWGEPQVRQMNVNTMHNAWQSVDCGDCRTRRYSNGRHCHMICRLARCVNWIRLLGFVSGNWGESFKNFGCSKF